MKKIIISLVVIATFVANIFAQKKQSIPIPEFKNTIMVLESNALKNLERVTPTFGNKFKFVASEFLLYAEGTSSNVRLGSSGLQFVFKMLDEETDPATVVKLMKTEVDKKRRLVKQITAHSFGTSKAKEIVVSLTFTKIKPGVYLFVPEEKLSPGEYVLHVPVNYQNQAAGTNFNADANVIWFAFGVD